MPTRGNTISALVDKIDSIEVSKNLRIDAQDRKFCETLQHQYEERYSSLDNWEDKMKNLYETGEDVSSFITLGERPDSFRNGVDINSQLRDKEPNPFARFSFSPVYAMAWIRKSKLDLSNFFVDILDKYFEQKYNLALDLNFREHLEKVEDKINFEEVVEEIFTQCGDLDLEQVGIERVKDIFRSRIYYQDRVKVSKNKFTLIDYVYFADNYSGGIRFDYGDSRVSALASALALYDTDTTDNGGVVELNGLSGKTAEISEPWDIYSLKSVSAIKFFKNGRIDIIFESVEECQDFFDFIEIHKLPESR